MRFSFGAKANISMWLSYKIGTQFGVSVFEGSRIPWNVSVSVISVPVRPLYDPGLTLIVQKTWRNISEGRKIPLEL